jgi:hypothetical protein
MRAQDLLISARFMTTVGHLTALLLLFSSIENNIELSVSAGDSQLSKDIAYQTCIAALAFGIFCFLFDFSGIFFGTTLFSPTINMMQIFFHFAGGIFLSWLITENWHYKALWPIVISCNIPTALIEFILLLNVHVFKTTVY